ncbi:MAG: hypothetical protein AAF696_05000, partial [Bacteroidota bacterium]
MRKASLAILATLFFCVSCLDIFSQNAQHPWAISAGYILLKYRAPSSLPELEAAPFQSAYQLSLGKYLGGA